MLSFLINSLPLSLSLSLSLSLGANSTRTLGRRLFQGFLDSGLHLGVHAPVTLPPPQRRGSMKTRTMCKNTRIHTFGMHTLHTHTLYTRMHTYGMHTYKGTTGDKISGRAHTSRVSARVRHGAAPPPFFPAASGRPRKKPPHTQTQSPSRRPYVARKALIGNVWVNAAGGPRPRCAQNAHAQLPRGFRLTGDYTLA
jgi:hypothetical protein